MSGLNIPVERINELGNYQTVATVRDIPDLTFEVQSLDVSTEMEAIALRRDETAEAAGDEHDFAEAIPIDIISLFKPGQGIFSIVAGIAIPYLTLESVAYRFGVTTNAEKTFTFKGDSVFYIPGSPYYQEFNFAGTGPYNFAHTAIVYVDPTATSVYAIGVCAFDPVTRLYERLFHGQDFTDTSAGVTLTASGAAKLASGWKLCVVYGSLVADTRSQSAHQGVDVKPAAVKGRNIDLYVAYGATPVMTRWTSVQTFEATRRVTLDPNREFGNSQYVSQDYDIAQVGGSVAVRPRDVTDLFAKIQAITNTSSAQISGALSSQPLAIEARVYDPNATTPTLLETLYVPDARFTVPATQGRVGQKLEPSFPFESDSGTLLVYKGARP